MAKTRNKKRAINEAVIRNPTVDIRSITIEDLLRILQEKSSVDGNSSGETDVSSKAQILEEKIEVLEQELCRKNQIIQSLQEQILAMTTEGNNPAANMSEDSFTLEENCGKDMDLNISIGKLLQCRDIAKRRAEELGEENPLEKSNCSLPSDLIDSIAVDPPADAKERIKTPTAIKVQKERRAYRKRKVAASSGSVKNMSAWLALAQKETVDKPVVNAKRKRSEEADKAESVEGQETTDLAEGKKDSPWLKIKSFASQHAKELNVILSEN